MKLEGSVEELKQLFKAFNLKEKEVHASHEQIKKQLLKDNEFLEEIFTCTEKRRRKEFEKAIKNI